MFQFDRRTASSFFFFGGGGGGGGVRHNQSQTSACLSINNKTMNLKEDSSSSEYGSLGIFIKQKCKPSSCHFLKIYMKISLNARRTSPPLNIAQNYKISLIGIIYFNIIGGSHPLCFLIFNQDIISFCVIKYKHLKEDSSSSEYGSNSGIYFTKQTCTTSL